MMKESYNYVICENENQAYDIRLTFKKQSKNSALKVPKIETLDIWLANAYQDYLLSKFFVLLTLSRSFQVDHCENIELS